ncbi:hypothetical protein C8Q77DRAFT_111199 [Trametes polyzona]|nr:hypothetical protein C8Q77DRAFT_111199 [Trametes polyzona]
MQEAEQRESCSTDAHHMRQRDGEVAEARPFPSGIKIAQLEKKMCPRAARAITRTALQRDTPRVRTLCPRMSSDGEVSLAHSRPRPRRFLYMGLMQNARFGAWLRAHLRRCSDRGRRRAGAIRTCWGRLGARAQVRRTACARPLRAPLSLQADVAALWRTQIGPKRQLGSPTSLSLRSARASPRRSAARQTSGERLSPETGW